MLRAVWTGLRDADIFTNTLLSDTGIQLQQMDSRNDHSIEVISNELDDQDSFPVCDRNISLQRHIQMSSVVHLLSSSHRELFALGQSGRRDSLTTHL
jgi:hypothetical protein